MVKGNWERRVQLANQRRLDSKARKEIRKQQKPANGESVYAKLMTFTDLCDSRIDSYLESDRDISVCSSWIRNGDCILKKGRCRFSHDTEPLRIRNIQPVHDLIEEKEVFLVPFREVLPRHLVNVRFVSVDGCVVFDYMLPHIWEEYVEVKIRMQRERLSLAPFSSYEEADDDEEDEDVCMEGACVVDEDVCMKGACVVDEESEDEEVDEGGLCPIGDTIVALSEIAGTDP